MKTISIYANPRTVVTSKVISTAVLKDNNPYRLKDDSEKGYRTETTVTEIPGKLLFTHTEKDNTVGKTIRAASNQHVNICNADLRGVDISGEIFGYVKLNWANFDGANLTGTVFYKSYLNRAKFIRVSGQHSIFYENMMETVDMSNSDFRYGNIILCQADGGSHFQYTDFTGALHQFFRHRGAMTTGWKMGKTGQGHEWKGTYFDWKPTWPSREEAKIAKQKLQASILQDLKWKCNPWLIPIVEQQF